VSAHVPTDIDANRKTTFLAAIRHNIEFPSDAKYWSEVVFGKMPEWSAEATSAIREAGAAFFTTAADAIERLGDFKQATREIGQATGRKGPALFMPLRAALTGVTHGPELALLLKLIQAAEIRARLQRAAQAAV
jgi:glutamyl-tRNA synthetase